jgi:hypothetical protein
MLDGAARRFFLPPVCEAPPDRRLQGGGGDEDALVYRHPALGDKILPPASSATAAMRWPGSASWTT